MFDALERWEAAVRPSELMAPLYRLAQEHLDDRGYLRMLVATQSSLRNQSMGKQADQCIFDLVDTFGWDGLGAH